MIILIFGLIFVLSFLLIGAIIWNVIKILFTILYWGSIKTYQHYAVEKPMEKSGFLKKKELEEQMLIADKEQREKDFILAEQNKIITLGLNKAQEMRIKYPYADEELFQHFLKKFPVLSLKEIDDMEQGIKKSHIINETKISIEINVKKYTLNDINGIEPLEENREDPIIMRIYKINTDYILYIRDIDVNEVQLLQSKDYLVIARVMKKIMDKQRELKEFKGKVKVNEINEIYNNVNSSINLYRRNRMDFLD